ncbi:hypothetical protein L596_015716 [Steinernema carpocapsae]|uniref:Uncharacterized protein n=1 Tax=Steinernema carpocapsae TaxID=34508 RepID=A0A4U5NGS9_STECR|nr:hypothetical protein L596_015716 [Steinernema carpocapsae]
MISDIPFGSDGYQKFEKCALLSPKRCECKQSPQQSSTLFHKSVNFKGQLLMDQIPFACCEHVFDLLRGNYKDEVYGKINSYYAGSEAYESETYIHTVIRYPLFQALCQLSQTHFNSLAKAADEKIVCGGYYNLMLLFGNGVHKIRLREYTVYPRREESDADEDPLERLASGKLGIANVYFGKDDNFDEGEKLVGPNLLAVLNAIRSFRYFEKLKIDSEVPEESFDLIEKLASFMSFRTLKIEVPWRPLFLPLVASSLNDWRLNNLTLFYDVPDELINPIVSQCARGKRFNFCHWKGEQAKPEPDGFAAKLLRAAFKKWSDKVNSEWNAELEFYPDVTPFLNTTRVSAPPKKRTETKIVTQGHRNGTAGYFFYANSDSEWSKCRLGFSPSQQEAREKANEQDLFNATFHKFE